MTMRPLGGLLSVPDALACLLQSAVPVTDTESVPLRQAHDRVLAQDVVSPRDVPPFARAAMDGYAVRSQDTQEAPVRLRCVEAIYAGGVARQEVGPQECIEVATGAPLPAGADAVQKVEETRLDGEAVVILKPVRAGQSVTRQGADIGCGQAVMASGTLLNPSRIGALAAIGMGTVCVFRRPHVKLGSSGNEIVEPGQPLGPGQIYNINAFTLAALLESAGCEVEVLPTLPDTVEALKTALQGALDADLVVISGGSSVGVKDLMIDAAGALGEILFHGVAIKPGKPTMLARIGGRPVVGMPGYPTSCLSNGYIFLLPLVARIGRRPTVAGRRQMGRLARDVASEADKFQVYPVRFVDGEVQPAFKESGVITSMSDADGYLLIPAQTTLLAAGSQVEVVFF